MLCQRYFIKSGRVFFNGYTAVNGQKAFYTTYKVQLRTSPTVTVYDEVGTINTLSIYDNAGTATNGQPVALVLTDGEGLSVFSNNGTNTGLGYYYQASAEL
jgi:hypothetical protein